MPTSAIIPLHLILYTNIFNGYSESPIASLQPIKKIYNELCLVFTRELEEL
jgi:hypothetical protein